MKAKKKNIKKPHSKALSAIPEKRMLVFIKLLALLKEQGIAPCEETGKGKGKRQ